MKQLLTVSLRQQAIFIPASSTTAATHTLTPTTSLLVANMAKLGFGATEPLLHALNHTTPAFQLNILEQLREVMGVSKNWTPLVKNWSIPTNESITDHIITFFVNTFKGKGTSLPCGHIIPADTFPLERYNGCPFCGTPFQAGELENFGQGSKIKMLQLWHMSDAEQYFRDLLTSKTALDASQADSLKILLVALPLPQVTIGMKETLMLVVDTLMAADRAQDAQHLFTTPTDILRYLWYKHTGFLQLLAPKTIIQRTTRNQQGIYGKPAAARLKAIADLKLKYNRKTGIIVATWLNNLPMDVSKMCETMHPKRNMWVRFIRALRLAEFSKRAGFEQLRTLMDTFYREDYEVWQGRVEHYRLRYDADQTLALLQQRPGLFARSLFANMLWFGEAPVTAAFEKIADKIPARLLLTIQMYAAYYFDHQATRAVKPLGGVNKTIPANRLLQLYDEKQLQEMQQAVANLCLANIKQRFARVTTTATSIYIDPALYKIPMAIGDRSEQIQDLPAALMGTRFPVEGDKVRLFMQWGKGLPAQHLDMDLSCRIAYDHTVDFCSYSRLSPTGCQHSGDIRSIPNKIGTAEYIDIDIPALAKAGARYVAFTCNAFINGAITPNLVVGWMSSAHRMTISEKTGVAYDPSCVQHQVRITAGLAKGLVFGILDVAAREIIWLEMAFDGQVVQQLDIRNVSSLLKKLDEKITIGQLLAAKAEAQQLQLLDHTGADEVYTMEWALNTAAVTQLLID
ncbi:hypothetical protein [Chitinophaga nivalis]|uniref:Prokaryotic RING finger family 4 n=1 Tax=Chitinophaga nivalis TaxID=2991709 RepID=A0ABT3IPQ0_9BACT|nr:hypothetical protein [Chitinophaga nivalis]MCW3464600.1 hypothetical protein [Chitinophaga nivalis]MCW3485709.1 hypothetical protein [Chitinophaga nivalis]